MRSIFLAAIGAAAGVIATIAVGSAIPTPPKSDLPKATWVAFSATASTPTTTAEDRSLIKSIIDKRTSGNPEAWANLETLSQVNDLISRNPRLLLLYRWRIDIREKLELEDRITLEDRAIWDSSWWRSNSASEINAPLR